MQDKDHAVNIIGTLYALDNILEILGEGAPLNEREAEVRDIVRRVRNNHCDLVVGLIANSISVEKVTE